MSQASRQHPRLPVNGDDPSFWTYPVNRMLGKTIRLTASTSIVLTDNPDDVIRKLKAIKTPFAWSATKALCKYFYHEIKIHKNIIDDCQEQIRTQRAIVKHLENDCKIHDTIDNAQQKIKMLDLLAEGCKSKKNRCMAENRRLRARTPGERHGIVFEDEYEDDGEVIEINDDTYERPEEHAIPRLRRACWPLSR